MQKKKKQRKNFRAVGILLLLVATFAGHMFLNSTAKDIQHMINKKAASAGIMYELGEVYGEMENHEVVVNGKRYVDLAEMDDRIAVLGLNSSSYDTILEAVVEKAGTEDLEMSLTVVQMVSGATAMIFLLTVGTLVISFVETTQKK